MDRAALPMPPRQWLRVQIEACLDYEGIVGDREALAGRITDHIVNNWRMAYLARGTWQDNLGAASEGLQG